MSDELNNGVNWTQVNNPSIWGSSTDPLWRVRIADSTNALSVARCAAKEGITIIQAHRAEIERLTAERDAAYEKLNTTTAALRLAFNSGSTLYAGDTIMALRPNGYSVSNPYGHGEGITTFGEAWKSFCANALDGRAPQPAAAPAVDAAPVGDATPSDEIIGVLDAISDAEHHHEDCAPSISQYEKLDGKTNLTLDALRALTLLVDSLEYDIRTLKVQKGETQS